MEFYAIDELNRILKKEDEIKENYALAYRTFVQYLQKVLGSHFPTWGQGASASPHNGNHYLMGSLADGCFSARLFADKDFEFEGDILLDLVSLPEFLIEPTSRPGVCAVADGEPLLNLVGVGKFMMENHATQGMVHNVYDSGRHLNARAPNALFNDVIGSLDDQWSVGTSVLNIQQDICAIMAEVLGTYPHQLQCTVETSYNGPAVTKTFNIQDVGPVTMLVNHTELLPMKMSFDLVLGARIKYNFWPVEAEEWRHRLRHEFPPQDLVEKIVRECVIHLVAKPIQDGAGQNVGQQRTTDTEWRLTFYGERNIIDAQSLPMRQTYFIFKIIFYRFFKTPVNGISLSSYLAKTTMYWLCEEMHPLEWHEYSIFNNVQHLVNKLFQFLDSGMLPHYFVRSINLLANVPKGLLDKVRGLPRQALIEHPFSSISLTDELVHGLIEGTNKYTEVTPVHHFLVLCERTEARMKRINDVCKSWTKYYQRKGGLKSLPIVHRTPEPHEHGKKTKKKSDCSLS